MPIPSSPEALRARLRELDAQIGSLKAEIQQHRAHGTDVSSMKERLDELTAERVRLGFFVIEEPSLLELPTKKSSGKCGCVAALVVVGAIVAVVAWLSVSSSDISSDLESVPEVVTAQAQRTAKAKKKPVIKRRASVAWTATVHSSNLRGVTAGADCAIAVDFGYVRPGVVTCEPVINCGGSELYRNRPAKGGKQRRNWNMDELFTSERFAYTYWLHYTDHGDRDNPPQLTMDTRKGTAVIWRDRAPAYRVELAVSPPLVRRGQPLDPAKMPKEPGFSQVVKRSGKVTLATGAAAVAVDTQCTLTVRPYWTSRNCRAVVDCGGQILYGAGTTGYNSCTVVGGAPASANDTSATDGDDIFEMDLPANRVVVKNDQPGQEASVVITLTSEITSPW